MNSPIFPNELLASMPTDPTTYVPISSPVGQSDDKLELEPIHSPQHAQQEKATSVAKKERAKGVGSMKKGKEKVVPDAEPENDPDSEIAPSPPPAKKKKTSKVKLKGKKKMTVAEISHYYSSTSEEHTPSPVHAKTQARQDVMSSQDADDEVAITQEIHSTAARTLKQMAQSAKRRPGLHITS